MLCPNCDGMLSATGCQACGWKLGQACTRNESVFPFKANREYPECDRDAARARFANRKGVADAPHHEGEPQEPTPVPVEEVPDPAAGVPSVKPQKPKPKAGVTIQ